MPLRPRLTLADLAPGRSNVAELILNQGRIAAEGAQRSGEILGGTIANTTQLASQGLNRMAEQREQQKAQDAVRLATSARYPSATQPVAGSTADVKDPGQDHINAILERIAPERRPQVQASIDAINTSRAKVETTRLDLETKQKKLAQEAADHWFTVSVGLEKHMDDADGGISAAGVGVGLSKGVPGEEEVSKLAVGYQKAYAEAQDPQSKAAVVESWRQQVTPLIQRGKAGGSLEAQKAWADLQDKLNPAGVAMPETGLVNPRTGAVIAPGPGKKETRTIPEQIAAATLVGDDATVAKLVKAQELASAATRDPNVAAARVDAARARDAARFDTQTNHSYEYNDKKLEARAKPLTDQAARFDRLVTTVNEKTAQADALIAPELLTVMAGGSGSGLRMTKAELENVVGGRSKWASLEAAIQKWVPGQALSITDSQRAEIQKLLTTMGGRIAAKASAIEEARGSLIDAKDVTAHRRILADLDKKLGDVGKEPTERKNPF
jgi:hypothetical protein